VARRVAAQIAISRYTAARVDGASTVVLAGVEPRPDRSPRSAGSGVVLMAQRLEPEKRPDLGLGAFAASGIAAAGWRLQVAGDGRSRENLQRLVDELGLHGSVELLGHRSDVGQLMAEADLFLAPTPGEHFGLSVLEAMASGLPVVADASGGHLETLADAGAAGLYRSQDTDAAASVLRDLASRTEARRSLGAALQARQRSHLSLERQLVETDAVYRSVL
jgi:glycosyltransferase involved in cell wall biosynthesis